ncbi:MAG: formate dehydrogenase subunit alpha, partial [Adhaeribacter sp.]
RMKPGNSCRSCLVQVAGAAHFLPSCSTLLASGMQIETHSPELEAYRKTLLSLMARDYPLADLDRYPEKEFHRWLRHYGLEQDLAREPHFPDQQPINTDASHPYLQVDMNKCILCARCVHICNDVQGQFVWHVIDRGDQTKIIPDSGGLLADSSCVGCGACADTCPTGAIEDKQAVRNGLPETSVRTVCAYCGVGCELQVGRRQGRITGIHPVPESPVSKGHLCVKGRYAWEYNSSPDRLTSPLIRENGRWQEVSWDQALHFTAQKLQSLAAAHGPDSIALLGSARATNEDNYLIQKFARTVIGTNNVENCARVCHQPSAKAMNLVLGTGAATSSFDDIEVARTILLVGTNASRNHPVVGARIKQRALQGANLIVIDPRKTELARYARLHLALRPGTNIPLLNALAHVILEENLADLTFLQNRVENLEGFQRFIQDYPPEKVAPICRLPPRLIREAARLYAGQGPAICFHGLGLTEHLQGTEGVMALVNLALLTGNLGKPGAGMNPLRGQNNVQGSAVMGCDPAAYPGLALVKDERPRFEGLWGTKLPTSKGLNLMQMVDASAAGSLKAMWMVGYDVFFSLPHAAATEAGFSKLDLVVVQDLFLNETARKFAHVLLPAASPFEKNGTFMNSERRVQRLRQVLPPPGQALADWEIITRMAGVMGKKALFPYQAPEEIWNEIRQAWPAVNGITYGRLEHGGLQWPCPDTSHPGTAILHTQGFAKKMKAPLSQLAFSPSPEKVSPAFPFLLITGRDLYQFNAATMTRRTPNQSLQPTDVLAMHPADARRLGMAEAEQVQLSSFYGQAVLPLHLDGSLKPGELFTTFSDPGIFINQVTSSVRDTYVSTPEYKITAVRVEKCPALFNKDKGIG